jgi:hypothetical protein
MASSQLPVPAPDRPTGGGTPGGRTQGRAEQIVWTVLPLLSWSLLAFVPFLRLAAARRRTRDWLVFWAYFGVVVVEIVLRAASPDNFPPGMPVIVMLVAAVHAFIEFSPSRSGAATGGTPTVPTGGAPAARGAASGPERLTAPLSEARPPGSYRGPAQPPAYGAAEELAHLHYVEQFLDWARTEGAITAATYRILVGRVAARQDGLTRSTAAATVTAPAKAPTPPAPAVTPEAAALPPAAPPVSPATPRTVPAAPSAPVSPRPAQRPPRVVRHWRRAVLGSVRSDLAVHGLAYLGVLLLFAGLFGLVAFSFGSVRRELRPVAELVVPVAVLGSAWLLSRRGLATPARALGLLGGLLVPVALIASLVDGAPVPPDPSGTARVAGLAAAAAAVSLAYAGWWRWHRQTVLRHLVAPALWLAVAMAALGFRDPIPSGEGIVTPRPGQLAAVLIAIMLTLAVLRLPAARAFAAALFPAALAGLGIAGLLEGLTAGVAGWPAVPVAVSGAAVLLALELCDRLIPATAVVLLQSAAVALTGLGLRPELGAGWAGVVAAVGGLAVLERGLGRAVPGPVLLGPVVVAVAGIASAAITPWSLLCASAAAAVWAHGRRLWPDGWPFPAVLLAVSAAIAPAGVIVGLQWALPDGQGAAIAGIIVLACAAAVRLAGRPGDRFWAWWIPAAATAVAALTIGQPAAAGFVLAAVAAAVAVALSPAPPVARVWLTGVAAIWAASRFFEATGVAVTVQIIAIAGAGVAAVAIAAWRREAAVAHAGAFGHLAGLACWPLAVYEADSLDAALPTAVLGLALSSAVITTVAQEAGRASVPDLLVRCGRRLVATRGQAVVEAALRYVPAAMAAVLLPAFGVGVSALTGFGVQEAWLPVGLTALALSYVVLARPLLRWHRVARVLGDTGAWGTVLAAAACQYRDPALVALAGVIAAPGLQAPALRRRVTGWVAWAASVPFAVLAANLAGLPPRYWYAVTFGWGAVLFLGGLAVDEIRAGRRLAGQTVRVRWLVAPVVTGALASAVGLAGSAGESPRAVGWMLIAGGAVLVAAGVLLRMGVLGGVGAVMALTGISLVLSWNLRERPWLLLIAAAAMLAAAHFTVPRGEPAQAPWLRWDLSLFVVAHGAAIAAVGMAAAADTAVAETTAGCGVLALAVAARLRRWPWALAGTVLILAGAAAAGPGWASLAFAGTSIAATVLATRSKGRPRLLLQLAGALAAAGAAAACLLWRQATPGTAAEVTSLASGVLALLLAAAARVADAARQWTRVWGGTALGLVIAAAAALAMPQVPADAGRLVAAGLAAAALGCGLAAGPLRIPLLREFAAAGTVAAGLAWAYGISAGPDVLTWGAVGSGLAASGLVLTPWLRRGAAVWVRPALIVSVAATGVALYAGLAALPDRDLLIPAFVLAGVLAVALAVGLRRPALAAVTPIPLAAAWLTYASQALTGQPQWFTVPLGAALLAVAVLLRSARRAEHRPAATADVISLEVSGMGLVVAASLVQSVTRGPLDALIGTGLGLAIAGWGALTQVRRRLFGGIIAVVASLLLLIVVQLVPVVASRGGVTIWLVLAGAGVAAILAAALLDKTRSAIRRGATRLTELTRDWE